MTRQPLQDAQSRLETLQKAALKARRLYLSGIALDRYGHQEEALESLLEASRTLPGSTWATLADKVRKVIHTQHLEARTLLGEAMRLQGEGKQAEAALKLGKIVTEYIDTSFAREAREKLRRMKEQSEGN